MASGQPEEQWETVIPGRVTSPALLLAGAYEILHSDWERERQASILSRYEVLLVHSSWPARWALTPCTNSYFLNSFCKVTQINHPWPWLFLTQGNSQPLPEAWQLSKAGVCQRPNLLPS